MSSPDVATYFGLDLVDLDEQALVDRAVAAAVEKLPEWVPREGNTELVLLEGLASEAAEIVYAVQQLPDVLTEVLLRAFGLTRDQGAPVTGTVRFTLSDTRGYTIPAGTVVRLAEGDEETDPVDLTTDVALTIRAGQSTGLVAVTGDVVGAVGNAAPAGTVLAVLDSIPSVQYVTLEVALSAGREPEDGAAFLARCAPVLGQLTSTLVTPASIAAWVSANAAVQRVRVLDLYDPTRNGVPGDDAGFVTVAVTGPGGYAVPPVDRAVLRGQLIERTHAGLSVAVIGATVTPVDVNVTVLRHSTASDDDVRASVAAAASAWLDPDVWDWSPLVRVNEAIAAIDRAAGVDVVLSVELNGEPDDLVLAGAAPLASVGTVTVTVAAS